MFMNGFLRSIIFKFPCAQSTQFFCNFDPCLPLTGFHTTSNKRTNAWPIELTHDEMMTAVPNSVTVNLLCNPRRTAYRNVEGLLPRLPIRSGQKPNADRPAFF